MPHLSADSLEDVSREAEATPGLQQLARILTIQLQVLNGADDLCMHVSDHTTHTQRLCEYGRKMDRGKQEKDWENQQKGGRREREKSVKQGVIKHHC